MRKALAKVSAAAVASQFFVIKALAALPDPPGIPGLSTQVGEQGIKQAIVDILIKVLDIITLLGVIFVIVAGIRLIISGGDDGEKDKAKKTIIYVIVGIIVVLFARVIVTFFAGFGG